MTVLGVGITSLLATAWLQALLLGFVATVATGIRAPARLRQFFWRCAVVLPPMMTATLVLRQVAVPRHQDFDRLITSIAGHVELAKMSGVSLSVPAASFYLSLIGWAWATFLAIVTLRSLYSHWCLSTWLGRLPTCASRVVQREASLLAGFAMTRPPLVRSSVSAGPFAAGRRTIVLPDWAIDLPCGQRRAVIAHEIRHLKRADPLWSAIISGTALALLLPFGLLAVRELDKIAEDDCDGWAAASASGQDLAEALLVCAVTRVRQPQLVSTMAGSGTSVRRVRRLINGDAAPMPRGPILVNFTIGLCLSASCICVPALSFDPDEMSRTTRVLAAEAAVPGTVAFAAEAATTNTAPDRTHRLRLRKSRAPLSSHLATLQPSNEANALTAPSSPPGEIATRTAPLEQLREKTRPLAPLEHLAQLGT